MNIKTDERNEFLFHICGAVLRFQYSFASKFIECPISNNGQSKPNDGRSLNEFSILNPKCSLTKKIDMNAYDILASDSQQFKE